MRCLFTLLSIAVVAAGQKPVISPGGIVNAASYTAGGEGGNLISSSSIASIFGANLASAPESASVLPLPTQIGGTLVIVGGVKAPLFYVSPGQINFQLPTNFASTYDFSTNIYTADVTVQTSAGVSDPYQIHPGISFGIFTQNASGCGQASALNIAADGTLSVNSPSNSASPGDYLALYGTGLALLDINPPTPPPPDGSPTPASPLVGLPAAGAALDLPANSGNTRGPYFWAGLAPGFIGLDQINFMVPEGTREGCAVPVIAGEYSTSSQPATVSIRKGGGPCADPPFAASGQATWTKTVATGTGADGETDAVTLSLQGSPGRQAPPPASFREVQTISLIDSFGPACPIPGYRSLNAGAVTTQNSSPVSMTPTPIPWPDNGQVAGLTEYRAVLPTGTLQPGSFNLVAQGGADVGGFQTGVQTGSDIHITNPFPPGTVIPRYSDITLNWTGGDANSWVTMKVVEHHGFFDRYDLVQTRASNGTATMYGHYIGQLNGQPVFSQTEFGPVEIIVEVDPDPSQAVTFSAPGLSLGGQSTWKYVYRFGGVTIQ